MRHVVTDPKRTAANRQGIGMTSQRTRERLVDQLIALGVQDVRVLDVMRSTPRHLFLDEALAHRAYEDKSLPIGHNQTLSRPYTVARMSELCWLHALLKSVRNRHRIWLPNISFGSVSTQITDYGAYRTLLDRARDRLQQMGIHNVVYKHGDGYEGWPAREPFDGIMVTAAPSQVPQALQWQLAEGAV